MTEFNLSKKIKTKHIFNYEHQGFHSDPLLIEVEDVKEFIKKLKEEIKNTIDLDDTCSLRARKIIDKLSGEKLC